MHGKFSYTQNCIHEGFRTSYKAQIANQCVRFMNLKGVLSLGQFDIVYIDIVDMHEVCLMMHRYAMIQLTACCFYLAVFMSLASLFVFIHELSILKQ